MDDDLKVRRDRIVDGLELRDDDDGHFVRGIVAPYNSPTDIGGEYVETLAPGVFKRSIQHRGDRVGLKEQHGRDRFDIGQSSSWEDTNDGLVGTFRLASTDRAREALTLIREGFLDGLSVGFVPVENRVSNEGGRRHVERVEAKLDHVGLVHSPAYEAARVLEARDEDAGPFNPDSPLHAPNLARYRALLGRRYS